jgi:hypothetical protein
VKGEATKTRDQDTLLKIEEDRNEKKERRSQPEIQKKT